MTKYDLRVGQQWMLPVKVIHVAVKGSGDSVAWRDELGNSAGGTASDFVLAATQYTPRYVGVRQWTTAQWYESGVAASKAYWVGALAQERRRAYWTLAIVSAVQLAVVVAEYFVLRGPR